ncbi:Panacea domain-containing protein [Microbacterium sp. BH-3-3-3]|uniref:Panacea domain-containing protein n=1 Tax=Microbacterium sp. BH-3-3-3 TaxID=1906742 RepID=UPI0008929BEA|nr:type II toxin-antitoxin system antitoxin SocA domain-containing protein [Microbacterium sp. BH-3-3-3]AOX46778.1 hypothetical protein BJP65_14055 [Microbacterium sp. BH-3-3-3]
MANLNDVAAYVLQHFRNQSISTMKLQKLCYIAQGWSLALRRRRLFDAHFEAWRNGPVAPGLYANHRGKYSVSSWPWGDHKAIELDERIVLDAVLANYEALTGPQLSALTHKPGTPWSLTRAEAGVLDGEACQVEISESLIAEHYSNALEATPRDR